MNKTFKRIFATLLTVLMLLSTIPFSAFAAPASDIPKEMLNNDFLSALAYTGYDVAAQKNDGTIFKVYGSSAPSSVRSNIGYSLTLNGTETISKSGTKTGLAPDISKFEANGLCCASYVSYVYFNYLPNIAGVDTSGYSRPDNLRSATSYSNEGSEWVSKGKARYIKFTQNSDGSNFVPNEEIPIGSFIIFEHIPTGEIAHVAIYAGEYNGTHFITHVGNDRGPEISTVVGMSKGGYPEAVVEIVVPEFVEENGVIEVYKTSEITGDALSGAVFVATNTETGLQYKIGPTSSKGYAKAEGIPFGSYTVKETVFPTDYVEGSVSSWKVTINSNTPNSTVTIRAKNIPYYGGIEIIKKSEDGEIEGIDFVISGNGINKTVTTAKNGKILVEDLKPGTYTVTEKEVDKYEPQESKKVTVVSGQTATVNFSNSLKRGSLKVTKTSEDGFVEDVKFKLSGTSLSGEKIEMFAVTNSKGVATFSDVLISGKVKYTLSEVNTAERYEIPTAQSVAVEWDKVTKVSVYNKLKRGDLQITKTSEDGMVEGIKFRLTGTSLSGEKIDLTATTNSEGIAHFEDVLITGHSTYTVTEVDTKDYYIAPAAQSVSIAWNEVTNKSFYNELKRGSLRVQKTSEDNFVNGMKFRLTGTSDSGIKVDEYATTDANGVAVFNDILIGKNYVLSEVNAPSRYVVPATQNVDIEWNTVSGASVENILKKWRADVFKVDGEITEKDNGLVPVVMSAKPSAKSATNELEWPYGETQGDATLEGAVYGVYKNGDLVDTYTTDKNGLFITKYYPVGDNNTWTIQEITPSEGYLLDPTVYYVDAYTDKYTVELNTEYVDVYEEIIRGKIAIIKNADDGSTQIEHPEENAVFEVYLKSAGSYENAREIERTLLTTDEYGFAETPEYLPYGVYVVKQIKGLEGKELMPAFDVNINEDGKTYRYLINNATFEAEIEIVKKDKETGKIIPASGIGFKVRNTDTGEYVIQHINYPVPMDIEIYYTNDSGKLMLPYALPYGNYEIIEQNTCYGYVLDSTPVSFKVDGSTDLVTVVKSNIAQKGTITITKTGEVFSSVTEKDGIYQPVYEVKGLQGAVYEIIALEDIITLDGTVRYTKGQVVDAITTGKDGIATSKPLYLGKYQCKEVTAPHGMVINKTPVDVELVYAGELVEITTTSASFVNERQKIVVDLKKALEYDDIFKIGLGDEISNVQFGLFATDDMIAADGKIIPKNAPLETAYCDKDGNITFATDLPVGAQVYIKELHTDRHYILNEDNFYIVFDYAGQETETVRISVNNGEEIENKILRGSVLGKKIDEDGFSICGALFGLFRADATEFTEETAILTCESNEIGVFLFENVPYGKYIVREIKAAPAFVLNENNFDVVIDEDGETIELVIENKFIVGSVQTIKVDKDYPENTLSGAVFEVYVDVDGNKEFDAEIDLLVGEMTEGENGLHTMENLRYNGYFLYEKTAPEGFIKDDGYYYFEIRENGAVVTVENEAGVGFINEAIKGSVTTTKIDKEYPNNKLSGAIFEVYADTDKNGEFNAETDTLLGELTETETGIYSMAEIRYGGYFLYEKTAPVGFVKDDGYHYFEIREDGEIAVVENEAGVGFNNQQIKGNVKIIKKDADSGELLSGVEFGLYDLEGKEIAKGVTDDKGELLFENIRFGKYELKELTQKDGYYKNEEVISVEITEHGKTVIFEVTNTKIPNITEAPKTGDNSNIGLWFGIMITSLLGFIGTLIYGKKAKRKFN